MRFTYYGPTQADRITVNKILRAYLPPIVRGKITQADVEATDVRTLKRATKPLILITD